MPRRRDNETTSRSELDRGLAKTERRYDEQHRQQPQPIRTNHEAALDLDWLRARTED